MGCHCLLRDEETIKANLYYAGPFLRPSWNYHCTKDEIHTLTLVYIKTFNPHRVAPDLPAYPSGTRPTHIFPNLGPRKGKDKAVSSSSGLGGAWGWFLVRVGGLWRKRWQWLEVEIGIKVTESKQNFPPARLLQISFSTLISLVPQAPYHRAFLKL